MYVVSQQTNRDVLLEGFTIYGPCKGGIQVLHVEGRLQDPADEIIASVVRDVTTENDVDIYDVIFDEARRVTRHTLYTLAVKIDGCYTYAGHDGRQAAFDGEVVFSFADSERSQTATGVDQGQLPGILFTL